MTVARLTDDETKSLGAALAAGTKWSSFLDDPLTLHPFRWWIQNLARQGEQLASDIAWLVGSLPPDPNDVEWVHVHDWFGPAQVFDPVVPVHRDDVNRVLNQFAAALDSDGQPIPGWSDLPEEGTNGK